jgi:hypothetical protein
MTNDVQRKKKPAADDVEITELLKRLCVSLENLNDPNNGLAGTIIRLDMAVTDLKDSINNRFPVVPRH